ncbi:hypothetical protein AAUPMB_21357, partial [Pasteurella multocida subsp. multocida str. Anand1_buffalo]
AENSYTIWRSVANIMRKSVLRPVFRSALMDSKGSLEVLGGFNHVKTIFTSPLLLVKTTTINFYKIFSRYFFWKCGFGHGNF